MRYLSLIVMESSLLGAWLGTFLAALRNDGPPPLNIESALLVYGPLGVACMVMGYAIWRQWKEIRLLEKEMRELQEKGTERHVALLQQLIDYERDATAQYVELSRSVQTTLERLSKQFDRWENGHRYPS